MEIVSDKMSIINFKVMYNTFYKIYNPDNPISLEEFPIIDFQSDNVEISESYFSGNKNENGGILNIYKPSLNLINSHIKIGKTSFI